MAAAQPAAQAKMPPASETLGRTKLLALRLVSTRKDDQHGSLSIAIDLFCKQVYASLRGASGGAMADPRPKISATLAEDVANSAAKLAVGDLKAGVGAQEATALATGAVAAPGGEDFDNAMNSLMDAYVSLVMADVRLLLDSAEFAADLADLGFATK